MAEGITIAFFVFAVPLYAIWWQLLKLNAVLTKGINQHVDGMVEVCKRLRPGDGEKGRA
jgi:hypothetical protein